MKMKMKIRWVGQQKAWAKKIVVFGLKKENVEEEEEEGEYSHRTKTKNSFNF